MDPNERCRGAGDENANLVQEIVKRVEFSVCRKWWIVWGG